MQLEFWFDFSCPYAYLASLRVQEIASARGVPLSWHPMLLGGVFRGIGAGDGPMATLGAAKAGHTLRDQHRWAALFGAPFTMPPAHPMRTVKALRGLLSLPEAQWPRVIAATYAAYWRDGRDITSDAVLTAVWTEAGLDAAQIARAHAANEDAAIKDELRRRTDEAIARGIFGAPAFVIGMGDFDEDGVQDTVLLWGQDRLEWVETILAGVHPYFGAFTRVVHRPTATPGPAGQTVDFYFDVASPYAYLALHQIGDLCRGAGATLRLRPVLLGGLFRDIGQHDAPLLTFPTAKREYLKQELIWWSLWRRVELTFPTKFPQRSVAAQRMILVASERDTQFGLDVACALGAVMWGSGGGDLTDEAMLVAALTKLGVPADLGDVEELVAQSREQATKDALAANTAEAAQRGVFGVPTCVIGRAGSDDTRLYWGQDRLELVAHALAGNWPAQ